MVSLGLCCEGSGKTRYFKHDDVSDLKKSKHNRGLTPNDPHPIGVSVRLLPKVARRIYAFEKFTRLFTTGTRVLL